MKFEYDYPMMSGGATVALLYFPANIKRARNAKIVLGRRSESSTAFPGKWCIPGGFINANSKITVGETAKQAAVREIFEETNIEIDEDKLVIFHETSKPGTDHRAHVLNICFMHIITEGQIFRAKPGDDISELEMYSLYDPRLTTMDLAFNHSDIIHVLQRYLDKHLVDLEEGSDNWKYVQGSILTCNEGIVAHGCNAKGEMNSGVASAIRSHWPDAFEAYKNIYDNFGLKLGSIVPVEVQPNVWVINMITQENFSEGPNRYGTKFISYDAIQESAVALRKFAIENGIKKVSIPKIGSDLGGGNWNIIQFMLREIWHDLEVTLYELG